MPEKLKTYILQKEWFDVPIGTEYIYTEQGRLSYYDAVETNVNRAFLGSARPLPKDFVENNPEWFKLNK